ncbi:MAG TPA: HlyD family efflux transporter periplasmic adaptor subunit [Thermoanaerobaculia bacterium]|nr:HlyD family efflux transporter periplasmic adaptor subunit [Thermoanaerobaculia bacterium]
MSARRLLGLGLAIAAVMAVAAVVALLASLPPGASAARRAAGRIAARDEPGEVPVAAVERRDFIQQVPAEGNLRAVRSTAVLVPALETRTGSFRVAWVAADGTRVRAGDVVVRFDPTDLAKDLRDAEAQLETARLKAAGQRSGLAADVANLERDSALAQDELDNARHFQKKDELIFSRHDILESEMDQQLAAGKELHAREQQAGRRQLGRAGLDLLAIDVRKAEADIRQARAGLRALQVTAPNDGVLILDRNRAAGDPPRVGDTVWSGMVLADIPDLSAMEAEVYVLEADAGGLAAGKPATVAVESQPGVEYPARIARVDTLAKPRLSGSPVQFFAVTLAFAPGTLKTMGTVKPGQRVLARLRLEERRGALVAPREAVFQLGGGNVVYRRHPGALGGLGFEPVPVALGPAGVGTVVIERGVAAGDLLALRDPAAAAAPRPAAPGTPASIAMPALPPGRAGGAVRP